MLHELAGLLCVGAALGGLVSLVWVISWFSARMREASPGARTAAARHCPRCGLELSGPACVACGWQPAVDARSPATAFDSIRHHLWRLSDAGLLPRETHDRLIAAVEVEEARLPAGAARAAAPARAAAAPSAPIEPPVTAEVVAEVVPERDALLASAAQRATPPTEAPRVDIVERAQRYEQQRRAASTDAPPEVRTTAPADPAVPRTTPAPPKTRVADLLAAFMEEKNVRWGELVGGLLIVGCSVALVISFWAEIAARPMLKFGLFNGVAGALFALGFYTARKWKLPTTSRGVLAIATLLVPLNFLSIAAFTRGALASDPLVIAGELASIALFSALVYLAGRSITTPAPWALAVGVLGSSISALLIRRWIAPDSARAVLYALAALPIACHAAAVGACLARLRRAATFDEPAVNALLRMLGLTAFAALPPCGLLLALSGDVAATFGRLAPLVTLAGAPSMTVGLALWRRVQDRELAGLRTAGTAIAVLGSVVMLAGVALAWPEPELLVAVAGVNFIALTAAALACELAAGHLLAGAALALGYLVLVQVTRGELTWRGATTSDTTRALLSAVSGNALAVLAGLYGAAAILWRWLRRPQDALYYGVVAGASATVSLALVTAYGFRQPGDPYGATWVYADFAILALVGAFAPISVAVELRETAQRVRRALAWFGSALAALSLVQGIVYLPQGDSPWSAPWTTAAVLHGLVVAAAALFATWLARRWKIADEVASARDGLVYSGVATSAVAALLTAGDWFGLTPAVVTPLDVSMHFYLLAVVWLVAAWLTRRRELFALCQIGVFAASTFAAAEFATRQAWYASASEPWLDPRMLQLQGSVWAVLCLVGLAIRTAAMRRQQRTPEASRVGEFLSLWRPEVERVATVAVVVLLVLVSTYAALPGAAQELTPSNSITAIERHTPDLVVQDSFGRSMPSLALFEPLGISHAAAAGAGSWALLALAGVLLVAGLYVEPRLARLLGLLVVAGAACPLLAAYWEGDVATASALRWLASLYFALGSVAIWCRGPIVRAAARLRWEGAPSMPTESIGSPVAALAALCTAPLAAMGGYVAWAALASARVAPVGQELFLGLGGLGLFAVIGALVLLISGRTYAANAATVSRGWSEWAGSSAALVFVLGVAPLVAVSIYAVATALVGNPVVGPLPGTFFARLGWAVGYTVPAALVAVVLVGYAVRERSSAFAFAAGLMTNLCATMGYLFTAGTKLRSDDPQLWTELGQLNSLAAALFGLAWLAVAWAWARRRGERLPAVPLLAAEAGLAGALSLLVLAPAAFKLFVDPSPVAGWLAGVAAPLGVTAAALSLLLAFLVTERRAPLVSIALATVGVWSAATLVALYSTGWDTGNWLAYHTLLVVRAASPFVFVAGAWLGWRGEALAFRDRRRQAVTLFTALLAAPVVVLAVRDVVGDPRSLWWGGLPIAAASLAMAATTLWSRRRRYLYAAGSLLVLATWVWYANSNNTWVPQGAAYDSGFFFASVLALALPAAVWLLIELKWVRPARAGDDAHIALGWHRPAAWLSIATLAATYGLLVLTDFGGDPFDISAPLSIAALVAAGAAALVCLWDSRAREAVFALYLFGLVSVLAYLDALDLAGDRLLWHGAVAAGAFTLATSYLWSRRAGLRLLAERLRMPPRATEGSEGLAWLVPGTAALVALVVAIVYWVELVCPERWLRITAAQAAIAQAIALAFLSRGVRATALRFASLTVGTLGIIALAWSWIEPDAAEPVLARSVATCVALVATAILYSVGFNRLPERAAKWIEAARQFVPLLVVALCLAVVAVLAQEVGYFLDAGSVPLAWPGILAVAVALGGLFLASLAAALVPGRDPLSLSERGRMAYVYAAEAVLALLFLHVRVTMPWLFRGFFLQYWPLVVMAIAFVGVGLGEWFRRRQQGILAEPVERTGVLLPLLPVLGFWFLESGTNYTVVLLVVGALYAALAVTRKSFGFGVLAALAANGGLWHYLHQFGGVGLLEHPQLWLIPPALCVLAAAYLNRERLSEAQMTSIRYITSMTVYLSSTADIFINGVADAPWLPLVLAALSLAGIFAGIVLRVRAFLFLGTGFLILSIVTVIYHAAVNLDQTWIWAASGIVVGVAIIIVFALFEKKRQDVLRLVDNLRQWQA